MWNKKARQIVTRLRDIEQGLAFDIVGIDADNGGEFINYPLWRHFHDRATPVSFTRCRSNHKNDQAHVEQTSVSSVEPKQWTHVRQLLGYGRLDDRRFVETINDLYGSTELAEVRHE